MFDHYKLNQLDIMLNDLQTNDYALARLKSDNSKAINLDEGALELLMDYYSGNITASTNVRSKYVKADMEDFFNIGNDVDLDDMSAEVERLRRADLFKGRVPKKIQDRTIENMDVYHMGLADDFEEACRELAPKGSELWKAWYYNDFRKFIPSAYQEEYLDFKKYPKKY